jgi:hypothetical protein
LISGPRTAVIVEVMKATSCLAVMTTEILSALTDFMPKPCFFDSRIGFTAC